MSCEFDRECPAGEICYVNTTWMTDGTGAFCDCYAFYGWERANGAGPCDQLGALSYYGLVVSFIMSTVSLVLALMCWYDFWSLVLLLKTRVKQNLNSMFLSLFSIGMALNAFTVFRILTGMNNLYPMGAIEYFGNSVEGEKFAKFAMYVRPFFFVVQVFTVVAALNVSVLWVELAYRAEKMKAKMINSVTYYRRTVHIFEAVYTLTMGGLVGFGLWGISAIAILPFVLTIIVVFIIGRVKMVRLLETTLSSFGDSGSSKENSSSFFRFKKEKREKTSEDRTRRTLLAIKRTSLHVIIGLVTLMISCGVFAYLDQVVGYRNVIEPGQSFSVYNVALDAVNLSILYVLAVLYYYIRRATKKIYRRQKQMMLQESELSKEDSKTNSPSSFFPGSVLVSNNVKFEDQDDSETV